MRLHLRRALIVLSICAVSINVLIVMRAKLSRTNGAACVNDNWAAHSCEHSLPSFFGEGILDFLPHLSSASSSELLPIMLTPQAEARRRLVFGIPVVMRKTNYVMRTLTSLVEKLCPSSRDYVLFLVMFAVPNTDTDEFRNISGGVLSTFSREIKEGLLEVMVIPPKWYELEFETLVPTFGDSKERMRWRTKQNLDYFYLMNYARHKAEYYMQLEDDIIATSRYSRTILNYLQLKEKKLWFSMSFATLGFIGKLFRSDNVKYVTHAILSYHKVKPVDWILSDLERNMYCTQEYSQSICTEAVTASRIIIGPVQFQHVGKVSSLDGKKQNLKEWYFEKSYKRMHFPFASNDSSDANSQSRQPPQQQRPPNTNTQMRRKNPPAVVESSMPYYKQYSAQFAYEIYGFMWFTKVKQGDYVKIAFREPVKLYGVLLMSGISPGTADVFAPDTQLFAQALYNGSEQLLGNISVYGDILALTNGIDVTALTLKVNSNHDHWVIAGHLEIDVEVPR